MRERNGSPSTSPPWQEGNVVPGIDFNRLRAEITMEQVLNLLDFEPSRCLRDQWRGPCPVHQSTSIGSQTFAVNLSSRRYYCHKCHSHGNQIELWAHVKNLPFYDAAMDLCHVLGRDVPWIRSF